jgi:hypothetical protein
MLQIPLLVVLQVTLLIVIQMGQLTVKVNWTSVVEDKALFPCLVIAATIGSLGVVLDLLHLVMITAAYTLGCLGYFAWRYREYPPDDFVPPAHLDTSNPEVLHAMIHKAIRNAEIQQGE